MYEGPFRRGKREAGESPARSRRCNDVALSYLCHWETGKARSGRPMSESEELPKYSQFTQVTNDDRV